MMTQTWLSRCCNLGLAGALAISGAIASSADYALAKSEHDGTLAAKCSVNTPKLFTKSLSNVQINDGKNRESYFLPKEGIFHNKAITDRLKTQLTQPQFIGVNQKLKFETFSPRTYIIAGCVYYPQCPDGSGGPCFICN